jgi:hypothetical protein
MSTDTHSSQKYDGTTPHANGHDDSVDAPAPDALASGALGKLLDILLSEEMP